MFIHDVSRALKYVPRHKAVFLVGPPGIGKTSVVHQLVQDDNEPLYEDSLVSALPEDIRGLPDFDRENDLTRWRPPEWFRRFSYNLITEKPDGNTRGTIFLDELPSAPPTVQVCAQKICQERQIGMYRLHPNIRVIVAGNRKEDKALVSDMPAPLRTKIVWINCEPHLGARFPEEPKGWIQTFAIPHEIHDHVIQFLRFKPEYFCDSDAKKFKQSAPNPRTWETASDILRMDPPEEFERELIQGTIGEGPAHEFFEYRKIYSHIPTVEDIKQKKSGAPLEKDPSFMYAVSGMMLSYSKGADVNTLDAFLDYFQRANQEFKMMFLSDLAANPKIVEKLTKCKTFKESYTGLIDEMLSFSEGE